jgi:hypothetical protein
VVGLNGFLVICGVESIYCFRLSGKNESVAKNVELREIIHFSNNFFPVISETGLICLSQNRPWSELFHCNKLCLLFP